MMIMSGGKEFGLGGMLYILAIIGIVVATIFEGYFGGFEIKLPQSHWL
jgi:hypothetical protein